MRFKKCLSAFLVSALILTSFALPTGFTSSAAETGITETETVEEQTGTDGSQEAVPDTEVSTETPEGDETDALGKDEAEEEADKTGVGMEEADTVESDQNINNKVEESGVAGEAKGVDVPQVMSILPLEEVNAYLVLNDYSEEEIKNMPVDKILEMLQDEKGDLIEIDPNATIVWAYFKDEAGNVIQDEYHAIGKDETIDLTRVQNATGHTIELIVGSGQQLDPGNVRYIINVYTSKKISEELEFEVYTQDRDSSREKVEIVKENFLSSDSKIKDSTGKAVPAWNYYYTVAEDEYLQPHLSVTSKADQRPDVDVEIYVTDEYLKDQQAKPITNKILNQDMSVADAGYAFNKLTSSGTGESFIFLYYQDGIQVDVLVVNFLLGGMASNIEGSLYSADGQGNVVYQTNQSFSLQEGMAEVYEYVLRPEYSAEGEYYCSLDVVDGVTGEVNDRIKKVVVGHYSSFDEAEDLPDIQDELFGDKGYLSNYGDEGIDFTIFFNDSMFGVEGAYQITVKAVDYDDVWIDYTGAPVVGSQDPWFRVTGANGSDGDSLDTYIVENGKEINMDTMYGYGYQTVLINEDVTQIQPVFSMVESEKVQVESIHYQGGKEYGYQKNEEDGSYIGDAIDCSSTITTVNFTLSMKDEKGVYPRNYIVKFVKKGSGPKLYVAGPQGAGEDDPVRSVFLDEYFEYKHDIFIANVGDEELTGLRVELDATNVKLDDYWTVGGENNDTLAPFDTTEVNTQYGELANIAKIRLLPDGEGEIEGTLTIYADGQDPVVIKLSGQAQNPQITTEELGEAVKYVPYSYMVTTNNMYDWTNVKFTMDGELPDGVEFIESTGEIYGVPLETGTFPITVTAEFTSDSYEFESSTVDYVLTVNDNTNENVYEASDENYQILEPIGTDVSGTYDFVLTETGDQLFVSNGEFDEFQDLWLNGEKLTEGVDYTKVAGSTRITISGQTFQNKANKNGTNTIAAEYRVGNDRANDLKRTAQNFRLNLRTGSGSGSGSWGGGTGFGSGMGGRGSGSGSSAYVSPYVTMIAQVVDKEDHPLAGYTVELHSTLKTAQTDGEGKARFNNVDFGNHTITVKDQDGRTEASKNFAIAEGTKTSLNGDTITARRGSGFLVKMVLDGNSLSFQSIEEVAVETGDGTGSMVWLYVVAMAGAAVAVYAVQRKRRAR